jgi:hypothetical protein
LPAFRSLIQGINVSRYLNMNGIVGTTMYDRRW